VEPKRLVDDVRLGLHAKTQDGHGFVVFCDEIHLRNNTQNQMHSLLLA
jgi:hypothetical protein